MPVFVDPSRCPCATPCFPAKMCPYGVLQFDMTTPTKPATLNAELCGDCRGVCTNFCDPQALRFAPTMEELRLVEAEILQTMSSEEISAERNRLREEQEASNKKAAAVTEVTSATFEQEVLQASLPVFVDLWAPWCGPCKSFGPVFEQVAQEFAGKAKFCKINTEAEQELARALRVQSIPTLFVFYGGQALGGRPGAMSAAQLRATVEQVLQSVQPAPAPPATLSR